MQLAAIIAVLTATSGFGVFRRGLRAAVVSKTPLDEDERGRAASLFRLLSKTSLLAVVVTAAIGIVAALARISDIELMAQALAAVLAAVVWGSVFAAIFEFGVLVLKKRQSIEREHKRGRRQ